MEIHLEIIGFLLIPLAAVHIIFPRYFDWKKDLQPLSLINREMMYVHTFFVALSVLLIGLLCASSAYDLVHTPLGRRIALGLTIFWVIRFAIQFMGYSAALWKGKPFETMVHIVFSIFWGYMSGVFFIVFLG